MTIGERSNTQSNTVSSSVREIFIIRKVIVFLLVLFTSVLIIMRLYYISKSIAYDSSTYQKVPLPFRCKFGSAGNGSICGKDSDFDSIPDEDLPCKDESKFCKADNCRYVRNPSQNDIDRDRLGDDCDDDIDGDGIPNEKDLCPFVLIKEHEDSDGDRIGNICDNCPGTWNPSQVDHDLDGIGDACDEDLDNDGIPNRNDTCVYDADASNSDVDEDGVGDICDNCPSIANEDQSDTQFTGFGDACASFTDNDRDSVVDEMDNCVDMFNPEQIDTDGDGMGDVCDPDDDDDGLLDQEDNCPLVYNVEDYYAGKNMSVRGGKCFYDFDGDGVIDEKDVHPYDKRYSHQRIIKWMKPARIFRLHKITNETYNNERGYLRTVDGHVVTKRDRGCIEQERRDSEDRTMSECRAVSGVFGYFMQFVVSYFQPTGERRLSDDYFTDDYGELDVFNSATEPLLRIPKQSFANVDYFSDFTPVALIDYHLHQGKKLPYSVSLFISFKDRNNYHRIRIEPILNNVFEDIKQFGVTSTRNLKRDSRTLRPWYGSIMFYLVRRTEFDFYRLRFYKNTTLSQNPLFDTGVQPLQIIGARLGLALTGIIGTCTHRFKVTSDVYPEDLDSLPDNIKEFATADLRP